ncbi:Notoamide biosynthesis transcriptional activator notL'-like protein [Cladobotryum mycophilum]|uniref:Notoamide biosynthesis transcriptional activator notL'-like protein n=1 Tax=Cladobotryum mycophilum TaxID=491253 RepID=A0ABR0SGA9_9HYPO
MYRKLRPRSNDTTAGPSNAGENPDNSDTPNDGGPSHPPKALIPRRKSVFVACDACRKRKERCDGRRPSCASCTKKGSECTYAEEPEHAVESYRIQRHNDTLKRENEQLRELFDLLKRLPEGEAYETLAHIRSADDPIAALRHARSASVLLVNPDDPATMPTTRATHPRANALNLNALSNSPLRVHARPWTIVAGDGIVSDLISSFFLWDDAFAYPFIDREAFLEDMKLGDIDRAKYCSPFLVNAVYASRYFTSSQAKMFGSIGGKDLGRQFLDEAKKLLDREMGLASLPTAQGLALLFTLSAYSGSDRVGMMYRYASYEMLHRLKLERTFRNLKRNPSTSRQRRIISKAVWGLFCFESIVAFVYLQQSLIKPPTIERCFEADGKTLNDATGNVDILGAPYISSSRPPAFVPGVLNATCDLSEILYKVMLWNAEVEEVGSDEDIDKRKGFFALAQQWREKLPHNLREDMNFTPQTCYLRIYLDEVVFSIIRPLHPDTVFDQQAVAKNICIEAAQIDVTLMERYAENFTLAEYSCMAACGAYNAAMTLVSHLGTDARTHAIFSRACALLHKLAADYPMARFILHGIKALAWSLGVAVPVLAQPYLEDLGSGREELRDIPLAFALPQVAEVRKLLLDSSGDVGQDDGLDKTEIEMGVLLSKWSSMSIE